jgi:uncharacterized protein YgiM (DUF1202 family)
MQNNQIKIIPIFLFLISMASFSSFGQVFSRDIEVADSLFYQKKFTESFDIYKAIHETGGHASPAMLLKMAYIREGLGDEAGALYYLNAYYLQTTNEKVFGKMEELAGQNDLKGYARGNRDWFLNIFYKYYYQLLTLCGVIALSLFAFVLFKRLRDSKRMYYGGVGVLASTILLFVMLNFGGEYKQGILTKDNSYIMSAPSSSADVLDVSRAGHRVKIIAEEDVWLKIQWGNKIGYVKNNYIKRLSF